VAGFLICLYSWLSLRWTAMIAGLVWLAVGILYGRIRRVDTNTMPAVGPGE